MCLCVCARAQQAWQRVRAACLKLADEQLGVSEVVLAQKREAALQAVLTGLVTPHSLSAHITRQGDLNHYTMVRHCGGIDPFHTRTPKPADAHVCCSALPSLAHDPLCSKRFASAPECDGIMAFALPYKRYPAGASTPLSGCGCSRLCKLVGVNRAVCATAASTGIS